MKKNWIIIAVLVGLGACNMTVSKRKLPYYGEHIYTDTDTTFHTVADFRLVNQEGDTVTNADFADKIYVADFFFTSCPTICPKMKAEMLRVYEKIEGNREVTILSHTIDPKHDNVEVLLDFSQKLGVGTPTWHFLTGDKDEIYDLSMSYMVLSAEDPNAPGGYAHSGAFLLVDKKRRIRGVYDGTEPAQVDLLLADIDILLKEYAK
jgi:protein SCO1